MHHHHNNKDAQNIHMSADWFGPIEIFGKAHCERSVFYWCCCCLGELSFYFSLPLFFFLSFAICYSLLLGYYCDLIWGIVVVICHLMLPLVLSYCHQCSSYCCASQNTPRSCHLQHISSKRLAVIGSEQSCGMLKHHRVGSKRDHKNPRPPSTFFCSGVVFQKLKKKKKKMQLKIRFDC